MNPITEKTVVFFGAMGSGKTSLVNRFCRTNFPVGGDLESETKYEDVGKNIGFWSNEESPTQKIRIFDTPGIFSADVETIKAQLYMLSTLLAEIEISNVVIVISASERLFDTTQRTLKIIQEAFSDHWDNFVVVFSKFDDKWKPNKITFDAYFERQKKELKELFFWVKVKTGMSSRDPYDEWEVIQQKEGEQKLWDSIVNTKNPITNEKLKVVKEVLKRGSEKMLHEAIENLYHMSFVWKALFVIPVVNTFAPIVFIISSTIQERRLKEQWKEGKVSMQELIFLSEMKK